MHAICKHDEGQHHDCHYTDARNRLIPEAEQLARQRMVAKGLGFNAGAFNREFLAAMDELARARGVVGDAFLAAA